jgi:hypothetical protein
LLHRTSATVDPTSITGSELAQSFATYFSENITTLHASLISATHHSSNTPFATSQSSSPSEPAILNCFYPASEEEISKLILASPDKQCKLDPIPTSLLKKCLQPLTPTITSIVNLSLASGFLPDFFKKSIITITSTLKKSTLYRPISNLSFLAKLTERIIKARLDALLSTSSLYNKYQSAYTKFHSTETALLSFYDHLVRAISQQKPTCLCLLDPSAAFDTIHHNIHLDRLQSVFGIQGTTLQWFQFYL